MNQILPSHAFFLPPPVSENNGVDFLGLRQANMDMMADLLPGTNNVTAYLRPFALLSWIFWKFFDLCERNQKTQPTSEDIRRFRERIEVLFTWGARLKDVPRIPGKDAAPPAGHEVPLTFDAWKRVQASTSLIAALWYGPGAKTIAGLGFIHPIKGGLYRTTNHGIELAKALDRVLRTRQEHYSRLLDTLRPVTASQEDASTLWQLWNVFEPTQEERESFRDALFNEATVGKYSIALGQRSSTIALARLHLANARKAQSPVAIRQGMYFSAVDSGATYEVPEALDLARRKWIALQIRQLQRLALETLLSWCEDRVLEGAHDMQQLISDAADLFKNEYQALKPDRPLDEILSDLSSRAATIDEFVAAGRKDPLWSPFALMETILSAFNAMEEKVVAHCLYAVLVCATFTGCCGRDEMHLVNVGGASRLSLLHSRKRLTALGNVPIKTAIQFVLESMVLSQHFATAVNRFDGENQRLRLSIEEEGLVPLVSDAWRPSITEDRLPTILQLAADCGLLNKVGENFSA